MVTPFETPQEFLEVDGPLYTFANNPIAIAIFLVLSVLIFLWMIVAAYQSKGDKAKGSNPTVMSILLITSVLSLAESVYTPRMNRVREARVTHTTRVASRRVESQTPIQKALQLSATLLGITVATGTTRRRKRSRRSRKRRN